MVHTSQVVNKNSTTITIQLLQFNNTQYSIVLRNLDQTNSCVSVIVVILSQQVIGAAGGEAKTKLVLEKGAVDVIDYKRENIKEKVCVLKVVVHRLH